LIGGSRRAIGEPSVSESSVNVLVRVAAVGGAVDPDATVQRPTRTADARIVPLRISMSAM
jgi:hypothetical protein